MVDQQLTGKKAVNDYFSSLLFDESSETEHSEPANIELKFAHVKPGHQLLLIWDTPLKGAQALCRDLFLLSCLSKVTGHKLREILFNSIQTIKR